MERCRQDKTADSNISNLHLASLLGFSRRSKGYYQGRLKTEPGLENKNIQVTLTHFLFFAASGALDFLDTCHQILTKTTLVYATIRASRYDARQQLK